MSGKPDEIDAAISNVERTKPVQITVSLRTGRRVILTLPPDLRTSEALELIGAIVRDVPNAIAQAVAERAAVPALYLPPGLARPEN